MKILAETHSHTIASGHAYNTIREMAEAAKEKNLELLAITEHGPQMPGSCHMFYFNNLRVVPKSMFGIELLLGVEANIMDFTGKIDMDYDSLKRMDIVIASLHLPCIKSGTVKENTDALIGAMKNPYVDIIGHPDDGRFPIDYERLVQSARDYGVILELNNNSLNPNGFRQNAKANDITMLKLCMQLGVSIAVASDAHITNDIADCRFSLEVLKEVSFPEELIANMTAKRLKERLVKKSYKI